jgi:hypothetical protein
MATGSRRSPGKDELAYRLAKMEAIVGAIRHGITWIGVVGIAVCGWGSIRALAGQVTLAQIFVLFSGKAAISQALAWVLGGSGFWYGWRERRLRKDTVERYSQRVRATEMGLDPGRSSSHLTHRGDTNPEDQR